MNTYSSANFCPTADVGLTDKFAVVAAATIGSTKRRGSWHEAVLWSTHTSNHLQQDNGGKPKHVSFGPHHPTHEFARAQNSKFKPKRAIAAPPKIKKRD